MLSTYSFKRKTFLVGIMIFASLAVTMTAQSVHAQNIAALRRAIVSDGMGSKIFKIDFSGRMRAESDAILEITNLSDSGALVGKYYSSGKSAPASTNVTGSINLVRGNTSRISFTVTTPAGFGFNETVFEGALRLGGTQAPSLGFMAGTFTNTVIGGAPEGVGPFPFCAMLSYAKPG